MRPLIKTFSKQGTFMVELAIEDVLSSAEEANSSGKHWHFHILSPTCCFNQRKDRYGLVVEIPSDKRTLVAYSPERPAGHGKKLVALLHGSKVLDGTGSSSGIRNEVASKIVEQARRLNERKIPWHHHMLFPDCALNPQPGQWTLTFEDPESGEIWSAIYEVEPIEDLKEVEALFYRQAK